MICLQFQDQVGVGVVYVQFYLCGWFGCVFVGEGVLGYVGCFVVYVGIVDVYVVVVGWVQFFCFQCLQQ